MRTLPKVVRIGVIITAGIALIVSVACLGAILFQGGVLWTVGDVILFRSTDFGKPFVAAVLAIGALVRLLTPKLLRLRDWALLVLLTVVALAGFRGPPRLMGDGVEYIVQTQSLVFDRSVHVDTLKRREYWNATNPYGLTLQEARPSSHCDPLRQSDQAGGGFGGLYPDRFNQYRYYHFWTYSAVVAPLYGFLHLLDSSGSLEYYSFRLFNVLLLLLLFCAAYRLAPHWSTLCVLAFFIVSPLIPYCDWQHPEMFCLSLIFLSFSLIHSARMRFFAPLCLGVAGSMNVPIVLFFPCHLLMMRFFCGPKTRRFWLILLGLYGAGAVAGISSLLYFQYYFGSPSVIATVGLASLHYASVARAVDIFISPFVGSVLFFPMCLLALPACITRPRRLFPLLILLVSVFAAAWLSSSTANFNAGQVGVLRYTVWLLAPLWYFVFANLPHSFRKHPSGIVLLGGLVLSGLIVLHAKTYLLYDKALERFEGGWRAHPEVASVVRMTQYVGDPEVLLENILGHELLHPSHFIGTYMWDLGKSTQVWLVSERALAAGIPLMIQVTGPDSVVVEVNPKQPVDVSSQAKWIALRLHPSPVRMHTHPVLGGYLLLWSRGQVHTVLKNQPLCLRSQSITLSVPTSDSE
jgi:hypothetical protein